MPRALCLLHANCQGEALRPLLEASPAFARHFRVLHVLNYTRAELPEDLLDGCALYLHQELGAKWGELSSAEVLRRLPPSCQALRLPNLFFQGYWPTWTRLPGVDFADTLLEGLLRRGRGQPADLPGPSAAGGLSVRRGAGGGRHPLTLRASLRKIIVL